MASYLQPSFDDLSTPLIEVVFCVLDLETTGGSAADCAITEIGAVKHRGGEPLGVFQTLVDPGLPIPPSITFLTGITQAMVVEAPKIERVLPTLLEFIGDAVIVGHNVRFDLSFLRAAADQSGEPRPGNRWVDTAALARRLVRPEVRNLRLQTLAAHFRSPVTPIHRALQDAQATAHVFHALLERAGSLGVTNLDDLLELPKARGSSYYRKIDLTSGLPRSTGVYSFLDRNGTLIYVGKASNLRTRVRQYFYGDERRTIGNMMRELAAIEHQVCETPLEAEITELRLIHAHRPRYNRRSRPPKTSYFVKVTVERFPRLSVVRSIRDDGLAYLGPFRSKRAADEVVAAIWDAVPIRRCRSRSSSQTGKCAPAQIAVASCPCDGSLEPDVYQLTVARLLRGIDSKPSLLLDPLVGKMQRLADSKRYEEAAWARDRHDALARALDLRRLWRALVDAGRVVIEDERGRRVVIDHGVFADAMPGIGLVPTEGQTPGHAGVPDSVERAEEARILWRWLERSGSRLLESTGALALPVDRPVCLKEMREAA